MVRFVLLLSFLSILTLALANNGSHVHIKFTKTGISSARIDIDGLNFTNGSELEIGTKRTKLLSILNLTLLR
jgi:hypothetical protein